MILILIFFDQDVINMSGIDDYESCHNIASYIIHVGFDPCINISSRWLQGLGRRKTVPKLSGEGTVGRKGRRRWPVTETRKKETIFSPEKIWMILNPESNFLSSSPMNF